MSTTTPSPVRRPRARLVAVLAVVLAVVVAAVLAAVASAVLRGAGPGGAAAGGGVSGVADGARERWTSDAEGVEDVVDAVALGDLVVVQTFDDPTEPEIVADNLLALDGDGEVAWSVEGAAIMPGVRPGDGLLVRTGTGEDSRAGVARYDADGDEVWSREGVDAAVSLEEVVVAEREEGGGTVVLDAASGEQRGEHPGRLAGAEGDRVVVVEGGDVVGLDPTGRERWRTTVDERFGTVPEAPDLEDLEALGEIDPATPEGRRELRRVQRENRALRDYYRSDEDYFGADDRTGLAAAVSGDLAVVLTGNLDPTDGDDGLDDGLDDGGFGSPLTQVAQVALDADDGTLLSGPEAPAGGGFELPGVVEPGPPGTVLVDGTLLGADGREVEAGGVDPTGVSGLGERVLRDDLGRLYDGDLDEIATPGPVVGVSDDGPYSLVGDGVVLTSWDDPDDVLARVDVDPSGTSGLQPVDGGLLVTADDSGALTLYR